MTMQQPLASKILSGILVCVFFMTTGCYSISKEFPISQGKVSEYVNCLKSEGGICKTKQSAFYSEHQDSIKALDILGKSLPPTIMKRLEKQNNLSAASVWNDPVQTKIVAFYDYLNTEKDPEKLVKTASILSAEGAVEGTTKTYPLEFEADDLRDYHAHIQESIQSNGWDDLELAAKRTLLVLDTEKKNIPSRNDSELRAKQARLVKIDEEVNQAEIIKRIATYIKAYLWAYFRNGEFAKVTVDSGDLSAVKVRLKAVMSARFPLHSDPVINALVDKLANEVEKNKGKFYFGDIGTTGFVTRSGDTFQFPPLEARIDPLAKRPLTVSKIDFAVVGTDLVRVVLEAMFDAISKLPAVSTATGVTQADIPERDRLPIHDPAKNNVDEKEFGQVASFAAQTEAATSTAFGQLIRGAGWMSLNNEYLGKLMETLVGVTVRKIMEQCAWCYYACDLNNKAGEEENVPNEKLILKVKVSGSRGIF